MIRLSDTLYESQNIRPDRLTAIRAEQLPLFDGLETLHLDRQDTCLNLAKRLTRSLQGDQLLYDIYIELLSRAGSHDTDAKIPANRPSPGMMVCGFNSPATMRCAIESRTCRYSGMARYGCCDLSFTR